MSPLHQYAKDGSLVAARSAIESGIDVNDHDDDGSCPLHYAARFGRLDIAALLLANGADANSKHLSRGLTPLHVIIGMDGNREPMISQLLNHGADPNAADCDGRTPLHHLMRLLRTSGQEKMLGAASLLCRAGADAQMLDRGGDSPMALVLDAKDASSKPKKYDQIIAIFG